MTEIFTFEALPARKGDALIIRFGAVGAEQLCVIDGGPGQVYGDALRPRLEDLRARTGLDWRDSLAVDLLMVSHVDDDHIHGVLDLADELERAAGAQEPRLVEIATLWHNSFDDIIGNAPQMPTSPLAQVLASFGDTQVPDDADHDTAAVLASIRQGYNLRRFAKRFDWEVNAPFPEVVVNPGPDPATGGGPITRFGGGLAITVLGPMRAQLEKLQKKYDDFLEQQGLGRDHPEAALAALSKDRSVANLSSIVVLMELGGKSMLLTGDARGDHILDALTERGLASEADPLTVDILKLQHHGSDRNVTPEFFRRIKARHYVFCGDGEHGNPERRTLEWLFEAHEGAPITLHFTYPIAEIDAGRKAEADKHGKVWNAEADSLKTLLAREKAAGRNFTLNLPTDRTGIRIDLLTPAEG